MLKTIPSLVNKGLVSGFNLPGKFSNQVYVVFKTLYLILNLNVNVQVIAGHTTVPLPIPMSNH